MNAPPVASGTTAVRIYRGVRIPALIVAGLELGVNLLISFQTSLAIGTPRCIDRHLIEGHRVAGLDLMAFPAFNAFSLYMVFLWATRPETIKTIEDHDVVVLELPFLQITYGVFLAYSVLLGILGMSGATIIESARRYNAVSRYCSSAILGLVGGLP